MKKKRRLKPVFKLTFSLIMIIILSGITIILSKSKTNEVLKEDSSYTYVNDYIFDDYFPVMNESEKLIRPYNGKEISVFRNFYEKDAKAEEQEKSIVLSEGTYIQNSGVDYYSSSQFDVVSVSEGTVTNITEDTVMGNTVEVKYSDDLTFVYQSLSNVTVKKGDSVSQGDVIAKSGKCSINQDVENGLHFEVYKKGQVINPEKNYDKTIKEITKDNE